MMEESVHYFIYCHIFPNGKRYIGITRNTVEERWGGGRNYKTCPLVDRAIKKYGWDKVQHEILAEAQSKEEAEKKERFYINKFETTNSMKGYNLLPGGDVATNDATDEMRYKLGNGMRGKKHTEEEKKKIGDGVKKKFQRLESNGHFGMKHQEETKKKMSESQKARWNEEMRNKAAERLRIRMQDSEYKKKILDNLMSCPKSHAPMSTETKEKLSKQFKGKWVGEKSPCSKPVLQYTKDGVFIKRWATARDAERAGIAIASSIGKCCLGYKHYHTAGGYVWRYEE